MTHSTTHHYPIPRILLTALAALLLLWAPALLQAQTVVSDTSAPASQQPGVDIAQNGATTIVNIVPPDGTGLSHNKFYQFNVDQHGLIYNNVNQVFGTSSLLGGQIVGNPKLQGGSTAAVILAEVTGTTQSSLRGVSEVVGDAASVIVANPNGIYANGAGFLNTPRVTLTTGTPYYNGSSLGFDVNGGTITIDGVGIDTGHADAFDIISRAAVIAGNIHAKDLNIITGRNTVDYQTLTTTPKADDGSTKPTVAVDSSALGGMYANKIKLIATEQGVGVNLRGNTHATVSDLFAQAKGKVQVSRASAARHLTIQSAQDSVRINQSAYGKESTNIAAAQNAEVAPNAVIASGGHSSVSAGNTIKVENGGTIRAGTDQNGNLVANRNIALNGATIDNQGNIETLGSLSAVAVAFENAKRVIASQASINATTVILHDSSETKALLLGVNSVSFTNEGNVEAVHSTTINTQDFLNDTTGRIAAEDYLIISHDLENHGEIIGNGLGTVSSLTFQQRSTGSLAADNLDVSLTGALGSGNSLENSGLISATYDLTLEAIANIENSGEVVAQNAITLEAVDLQNNTSGQIGAGVEAAILLSGDLINSGEIISHEDLTIDAVHLTNNSGGQIGAAEEQVMTLSGNLINYGELEAGLLFDAAAGAVSNLAGGLMHSGQDLLIDSIGAFVNSGSIDTADLADIDAASIFNNGVMTTSGTIDLESTAGAINLASGGNIRANDFIANSATSFTQAGVLQSTGHMDITGPSWISLGGYTLTNGGLSLDTFGNFVNSSNLFVTGDIDLTAGSFYNYAMFAATGDTSAEIAGGIANYSVLFGLGRGDFQSNGGVNNWGGIIYGDDVSFTSIGGGRMGIFHNNVATYLESWNGDITIRANSIQNMGIAPVINRLAITTVNDMTHLTKEDVLVSGPSSPSKILAGGSITLDGSSMVNHFSQIAAGGNIFLTGGTLVNSGDALYEVSEITPSGRVFADWYYKKERRFKGDDYEEGHSLIDPNWNVDFSAISTAPSYSTFNWHTKASPYDSSMEPNSVDGLFMHFIGDGPVFTGIGGDFHRKKRKLGVTHSETFFEFRYHLRENAADMYTTTTALQNFAGTIEAGGGVYGSFTGSVSNLNGGLPFTYQGASFSTAVNGHSTRSLQSIGGHLGFTMGDPLAAMGGLGYMYGYSPTSVQYVFESHIPFLDLNQFVGSDYFFERVPYPHGNDYEAIPKRLGDAFFETRYIGEQIFNLTGRRFINNDIENDYDQMKFLINNAADASRNLQLSPGVALTEKQFNNLNKDIIWMVEKDYNGQKVLEPVVYLAQATVDDISTNGAAIIGDRVILDAAGDITNSGLFSSESTLIANAGRDLVLEGGRVTGSEILLTAANDIRASGQVDIDGESATLEAGRDITLLATETTRDDSAAGVHRTRQTGSSIFASGDLRLRADRDISLVASSLFAEGDLSLGAGRDLSFGVAIEEHNEDLTFFGGTSTKRQSTVVGSTLSGRNLSFEAGRNMDLIASRILADGDLMVDVDGDLNILSHENTSTLSANHHFSASSFEKTISRQIEQDFLWQTGSLLRGDNVSINSGNNIRIQGSNIVAEGDALVEAAGNFTIESAEQRSFSHFFEEIDTKDTFKLPGHMLPPKARSKSNARHMEESDILRQGSSSISATGQLGLKSGNNITVTSSHLAAREAVTIEAAQNILFNTALETIMQRSESTTKGWGGQTNSGKAEATAFAGFTKSSSSSSFDGTYHTGSTVFSDEGDLSLSAGGDFTSTNGQFGAGQNLSFDIEGNANFLAAFNEEHSTFSEESFRFGVEAKAGSGLADAAIQLAEAIKLLENKGGEAEDVGMVAGAYRAIMAIKTIFDIITATEGMASGSVAGASVAVTASKSERTSEEHNILAALTGLQAGGNLSINSGGNIEFQGTRVEAGDAIKVDAAKDITLTQALSESWGSYSSKSGGASVGLGFSVGGGGGGYGFYASGSFSQSDGSYSKGAYHNTDLLAGGQVTLNTGGQIHNKQNGVDWDEEESSLPINVSFSKGYDIKSVPGQSSGSGSAVDNLLRGLEGQSDLGDAFVSAAEAAIDHAENQLLYATEEELANLSFEDFARQGATAFGANLVGHAAPLEQIWANSDSANHLLKPLLHGAVGGGIGELFGEDFGSAFAGGASSSLVGGLAKELGVDQQLAAQLVSIAGGWADQQAGGSGEFGALLGGNIWEYNDQFSVSTLDWFDRLKPVEITLPDGTKVHIQTGGEDLDGESMSYDAANFVQIDPETGEPQILVSDVEDSSNTQWLSLANVTDPTLVKFREENFRFTGGKWLTGAWGGISARRERAESAFDIYGNELRPMTDATMLGYQISPWLIAAPGIVAAAPTVGSTIGSGTTYSYVATANAGSRLLAPLSSFLKTNAITYGGVLGQGGTSLTIGQLSQLGGLGYLANQGIQGNISPDDVGAGFGLMTIARNFNRLSRPANFLDDAFGFESSNAPRTTIRTAVDGAGRDFAAATKVRQVMPGERFADVLQELKAGQVLDGVEMNLVRLKGGQQWIVRGGRTGTDWTNMLDELHKVKFHTHPRVMGGPSPDDLGALNFLGQRHGFIWERGMPDILMFNQEGQIIRTLTGY